MLYASESIGDLIFITVVPPQGVTDEEGIHSSYRELAEYLESNEVQLLHEKTFGVLSIADTVTKLRGSILNTIGNSIQVPLTYVEGTPFNEAGLAGIHAIVAKSSKSHTSTLIEKNGLICGCQFQGNEAEYLFLSDVARLLPPSTRGDRLTEAHETIKLTNDILLDRNWSFKDVRRTWFYLDNILDWYGEFNQVRNKLYKQMGLFNSDSQTIIPASTGIWGKNPDGISCTLDVVAMRSLEGQSIQINRLKNPKQNEATDYGSAFSRGVSITTQTCKYIFISGTASIDEQGQSIHFRDMKLQTIRTIKNVESLLQSEGAQLSQIQRATAFVKNKEDIPIFEQEIMRNGMPNIPIIRTIADVCRDELLFEFDAAAVLPLQL